MVQKKGGTVLSAASLSINKVLDGMDSFLYIRFSEFPDGRNMSSEPNEKTKYIGVVSTKENRPPSDPARYAWTAFKGADGEKTFLWVRYSEQDGGKPKMESNPSAKTQYMGVYSGPETTAPTDATRYRWVKTKGEQGESSYLHVRYSDYADGTGFYEKPKRTTMFIGVAVTVSEKAPVNKEAYDWAEFGVNIEFGGRNYILESLAPVVVKKQGSRKWINAYPSSRFSKDWPGYTGFAVATIHGYTSGTAYPENVRMRLVGLKGTSRVYEEEFVIPQSELKKKEFEHSHVFIVPESASTANSYLLEVYSWTEDMELEIDRIKLERGNRPTDWSGAPEDVNNEMMEIKKESASLGVLIQKLESGKASTAELQALATELSGYVKSNTSYGGVKITDQGVLLDSTNMEVVLDQRNGFLIKTKSPGQTVLQVDKDGKFIINASNLNTDVGKAQAEAEKAKKAAEEANKTKVKSVEMQYYLSSSTTILSGGKWESVAPEWAPNKFMWNRTKTVYGDGSIVYTPSEKGTCIAGAKGQDGIAGKDGVGIVKTTIDYAISDSGSQRPENGWSPSVPQLTKGRYLWTRTVWKYSDSSEETGYSVTYISKDGNSGKDGLPGKDGVGIKTTTITYAKSTNGVSAPGSGWTSSVPSVPDGQYLWTKTVWMYTDGTSETGYSVAKMGEKGGQGVQGPPGKDGQATYTWIKYADSPTSGMSDSPTNKKYIGLAYNKTTKTESTNYSDYQWSLVKGSDGIPGKDGKDGKPTYTWIVYADDIKGSGISRSADGKGYMGIAYNKDVPTPTLTASLYEWVELVGALDFGGRNYIVNSATWQTMNSNNGPVYPLEKGTDNKGNWVRGYHNDKPNVFYINAFFPKLEVTTHYSKDAVDLIGETVTLSVDLMPEKPVNVRISGGKTILLKEGVWTRVHGTQISRDRAPMFVSEGNTALSTTKLYHRNWKLEKGNRPSDWSMAPEDARVYMAWANSPDGRLDFSRSLPNENAAEPKSLMTNLQDPERALDKSRLFTEGVVRFLKGDSYPYSGIYWTAEGLNAKPNKSYVFGYKYRKVSGKLVAFGGHTDSTWTNNSVYLDGKKTGKSHNERSSALGGDDSSEKNVQIYIETGKTITPSDRLYIQPNRGEPDEICVDIWDMYFREVDAESEISKIKYIPPSQLSGSQPLYLGNSALDSQNPSDYAWSRNPESIRESEAYIVEDMFSQARTFTTREPLTNLIADSSGLSEMRGKWSREDIENGYSIAHINGDFSGWGESTIPLDVDISTISPTVSVYMEFKSSSEEIFMISIGVFNEEKVRIKETANIQVNNKNFSIRNLDDGWSVATGVIELSRIYGEKAGELGLQIKKATGVTGTIDVRKPKVENGHNRDIVYTTGLRNSEMSSVPKFIGTSLKINPKSEGDFSWRINPRYVEAVSKEGLKDKVDSNEYENDREEIQTSLGDKASKDELKEIEDLANQIQDKYEEFIKDGGRYEADLESLEKRISAMVLNLGDKIAEFNFINKYIKLGEEGLLLGDSTSLMNILISDKRISFFDGGKEVAYMEGQEFRINRGTILESLQVGSHKMEQVDANSTIFTFIS